MDYTLIGAKGISQLNDLKGKIVGVTGAGGIAEYAAVEGLAKKGLVRDRDYKILYGVGNSPSRAQALEAGRIQASPFSFLERLELEQKGFPVLFEIGKVLPGFPFVVILAAKRKVETDPEGVVALLRGMKRGSRLSQDRQRQSRRSGDQERNFRRSDNDSQDGVPVFRAVLSIDHQGRHRCGDRRRPHRSGSKKVRRRREIFQPCVVGEGAGSEPMRGARCLVSGVRLRFRVSLKPDTRNLRTQRLMPE